MNKMLGVPFLQKGKEIQLTEQYNKQLQLEKELFELENWDDHHRKQLSESRKVRDSIGPILAELTLNKYKDTRHDPLNENWTTGDAIKLLKDWHIRETPEVVEYFKSYINSSGFNRILQNQDAWWNNRHPYRKYLTNSEIEETKDFYLSRKFPKVFSADMYASQSWYRPWTHTAYVGQKNQSDFNYEQALGHELSHGMSPTYTNGQKEALDQNQNTKKNNHDEYRSEKMADLWGLRYMLYKEGIYDSRSDKDITTEEIQKLRDKYPNFRFFQQMDNEQLQFQLNHVAQNNVNSNPQYAKSGIKIKKKNRGKFTEYCDGKVTQECIDKAKKSGNKKLIKRATFAENSRKWKHQKGGPIKRLDIKNLRNDPEFKKNFNWYMNDHNLEILQDSMINRNMGYVQRVALLSQVIPESGGDTKPHGNGAIGLIGWRGPRAINLPNNLPGQIHQLMSEIYDNPNAKNWSHGGQGTGIQTGKEMMKLFKTTPNSKQATKSLMKGLVRPEKSEWDKRLQFLQILKKHMK